MKKGVKCILIALGTIAALAVAASLAIPPVVQHYVEKNSKTLIGRTVATDKLRINFFTGGVRMNNFILYEADDKTPFAAFGQLKTRVRLIPLLSGEIRIGRTTLIEPRIHISQLNDLFNFSDLMDRFRDTTSAAGSGRSADRYSVSIDRISIREGRLSYRDLATGGTWNLEDLTLDIPGLSFDRGEADAGIDLRFAGGGALRSEITYDMRGERYDLRLALTDFPVDGLLPYVQQALDVEEMSGVLNGDFHIRGALAHVMDFDLRGTAAMTRIALLDRRKRSVVEIDSVAMQIRRINPARSAAEIDRLWIRGAAAAFEIDKDGTNNFQKLLKATSEIPEYASDGWTDDGFTGYAAPAAFTPSAPETVVPPLKLTIRNLQITGSTLFFADRTPAEPFTYTLGGIDLTAGYFNPEERNTLSARASLPQGGNLRAEWTGRIGDPADQRIVLEANNLSLKDFSPYAEACFGYPLVGGTLSFKSRNEVAEGRLNGATHVELYRPQVGSRARRAKPEYNVPLKTGLYLMSDNRGRITIDLPVGGDIASPDFSYGKIAAHAFANALSRAVTSPVSFLADALGLKTPRIDAIPFDPLRREFTAEQYGKFGELAEIILSKPGLTLRLTQRVDLEAAAEQEAMDHLLRACYASVCGLDPAAAADLDPDEYRRANLKPRELLEFTDSLLEANRKRPRGSLAQKAMTLYEEQARKQALEGILFRNVLLHSHLTAGLGIPETCLHVAAETEREMKRNRGRNLFSVEIALPDEKDMLVDGE